MSTFHPFPHLPKELRLKIYTHTFSPRLLQLGVDAGIPFPPEMTPLGTRPPPTKNLHTHLPSLFAVCQESREWCKFIFIPFGPTFIHPKLDTLYISLYAAARMRVTDIIGGAEGFPVGVFDRVAVEYGLKCLPADHEGWGERPKKWQVRHGVKELCVPGHWPATDYAEIFKFFGKPREVLLVTNGTMNWSGGFSRFASWGTIELVATKVESGDQENLLGFLKTQLSPSLGESMEFSFVDAVKKDMFLLDCPFSWSTYKDEAMERYIWL